MSSFFNDDQIAEWLRQAAGELHTGAVALSGNSFRMQGKDAENEQDLLERVVRLLGPCRTQPMPEKVPYMPPRTPQSVRLTPELFGKIGLQREAVGRLAGGIPLVEASPEKMLSKGGESIIKQLNEQGAPPAVLQGMRVALAKLALLRECPQIPTY